VSTETETGGQATGGWICPYCHITVSWGVVHDCPMLKRGYETLGETHYLKCPHCGELIEARILHYIYFPDFGIKGENGK